jgi:hypothetical protein
MEQWSSRDRADNRDQQPEGTFSAPTNNRKEPLEDNRLLQPLLDSSQGKLHCTTHPTGGERLSTGLGMAVNKENTVDLRDPDKKNRNEDAQQSQGPNQLNNKEEQFHQSKSSSPHQLYLTPTKRVNTTGRCSNTLGCESYGQVEQRAGQ